MNNMVLFFFLIVGLFDLTGQIEIIPEDDAVFDQAVAGFGNFLLF